MTRTVKRLRGADFHPIREKKHVSMSLYVLDEFVVTKFEKLSGCSGVKLPSINEFRATANGGNGKPYLIPSRELRSSVFLGGG